MPTPTATPIDENDWIAGLRAGRLDAFRAIFDAYTLPLQRFAAMVVPRDVAEDIVQDVLFRVWERRETIVFSGNRLGPYLFGAVRNRIADYRRHQRVIERASVSAPDVTGLGAGPASPDIAVTNDDLQSAFNAALHQLSDLQRSVLMLRWTQGMSYAQIAQVLSISTNAAMSHASRIRQVIRPTVERFFGPLDP